MDSGRVTGLVGSRESLCSVLDSMGDGTEYSARSEDYEQDPGRYVPELHHRRKPTNSRSDTTPMIPLRPSSSRGPPRQNFNSVPPQSRGERATEVV